MHGQWSHDPSTSSLQYDANITSWGQNGKSSISFRSRDTMWIYRLMIESLVVLIFIQVTALLNLNNMVMKVLYKYLSIYVQCVCDFFGFFTITRFLGQICSELGQVFIDINIRFSSIYFVVVFKICSGRIKRVHAYSLLQISQSLVCFYLLSVQVGVIQLCL